MELRFRMRYIRLIHPAHWSSTKKRLIRLAFRNSSPARGGGISIIELDCAKERSKTICAHVAKFYGKFKTPVLFWEIESNRLPAHDLEQATTPQDDDCHHNIRRISDEDAENFFKKEQERDQLKNFFLCPDEGNPNSVTKGGLDGWVEAHVLNLS